MFDTYDLLEYLLNKAYQRQKVSYGELYREFGVNAKNRIEIANFFNALENAERRIIEEIKHIQPVPIYTVIFYRQSDNLPGTGFFDVFNNRNFKLSNQLQSQGNEIIYNTACEILENDLNSRFPDDHSLQSFIQEVRIFRDIHQPNVIV